MSEQLTLLRTQRDAILDSLQRNHRAYLVTLRSFARLHAMRHGIVTIDDVRAAILSEGFFMPKDIGCDERVLGTVFRCKDFEAVGQRVSSRKERVARSGVGASYVTEYRLVATVSAA